MGGMFAIGNTKDRETEFTWLTDGENDLYVGEYKAYIPVEV